MALDQRLQQCVAEEIQVVIRKSGGQLTYEALKQMDLTERVLQEGLRPMSPSGSVFRKCNQTKRVGDVLVEKDTNVIIVSDTMHKDPAIFPDPERFDPDHHTPEARERRHPYAFIPFGEGPRVCIAERFALLMMKLAFAVLVRDFTFSRGPNFEEVLELDKKSFSQRPVNGFHVRAEVRA